MPVDDKHLSETIRYELIQVYLNFVFKNQYFSQNLQCSETNSSKFKETLKTNDRFFFEGIQRF